MTVSRRLFIGGLLSVAAAPAVVKASSLMQIKAPKIIIPAWYLHFDTATGRMPSHEPAWHEFRQAEGRIHRLGERQTLKNQLFGARYGTQNSFELGRRMGKPMMTMDYTELELRVIAQREERDLFDKLKLDGIFGRG